MIKHIKDSLMIAAALALVLLLLFIYGIIVEKPISNPPAEVTGNAVALVGDSGFLEILLFFAILVLLFLIYRALRKPAEIYSVPEPKFKPEILEEAPKVEPKAIPPKFYEPIYKKPSLPVRNVYVQKNVVEEPSEKDEGVHQELTSIRDMLSGGEHEIAKKRFVRVRK